MEKTSTNVSPFRKRECSEALNSECEEKIALVVLYDGVCGLCDRTIQFLLNIDKNQILKFATLQGETGSTVLKRHFISEKTENYDSVIFIRGYNSDEETVYFRSGAVMQIFKELGGKWCVLSWLRIIPRFMRDGVYNIIANNRYKWFGKFDQCRLPSPEERARFLP